MPKTYWKQQKTKELIICNINVPIVCEIKIYFTYLLTYAMMLSVAANLIVLDKQGATQGRLSP